ncbi:MAG: J domain-containing protein [Elusimicrobiota bacterium]|nr:J domain-containing protein [Elusimicrobiota bacterium]
MENELRKAARLMDLGDSVSLTELRESYKRLALKFHPDRCPKSRKRACEAKFKKLNAAYQKLLDHCLNYSVPLDAARSAGSGDAWDVEKDHINRFYDGWWFDLDEKE